jgi:hypothetical protein
MIPQEDHPEVNFVGLIIGPRGNTLKTLEKEVDLFIVFFYFYKINFLYSFRRMLKSLFEVNHLVLIDS